MFLVVTVIVAEGLEYFFSFSFIGKDFFQASGRIVIVIGGCAVWMANRSEANVWFIGIDSGQICFAGVYSCQYVPYGGGLGFYFGICGLSRKAIVRDACFYGIGNFIVFQSFNLNNGQCVVCPQGYVVD